MKYNLKILAIAESNFDDFYTMEEALQARLATLSAQDTPGEEEQSRLLSVYDNVAVVDIKGSLTNRESYWNRFFGAVAYSEIKHAIIQAVESDAQALVLDIDSPGGSVNGMSEIGEFISNLQIPTFSYSSGSMCSAAYFIGAQSDKVYAGDFSTIGSVGVVAEVYDRTKMLADIGVKFIRFRSGPLKAVGSPNHKLTKEETAYLQAQVDLYGNKFYNIVSAARGMPVSVMETYGITTGKTFIGDEALRVNLIDGIKTFDEVMLEAFSLAEKRVVDKNVGNGISLH